MAELQVRAFGRATLLELREGDTLLSRAEVRSHAIVHQTVHYRACTLGAVFTPPELRRAGHARTLVALATSYVQGLEVDLAGLHCRRELIPLYASSGWQVVPTAPTDHLPMPQRPDPFVGMMIFFSDRARAMRVSLTSAWGPALGAGR